MADEFAAKVEQARSLKPLQTLMVERGKGAADGKYRPFTHCPYCSKKGSASLREHRGRQFFKCFNSACPSGTSTPRETLNNAKFSDFSLC
jgi:hypothetical protein